jgi:hypothetical protein
VLCDEQLTNDVRIDELFYNTMKKITSRIENSVEVNAPVDNDRPIVTRDSDRTKMTNWKNRLSKKLQELDVLFDIDCTYSQAIAAWRTFFNHSYWDELANASISESFSICKSSTFTDTEEYIDEMYDIDERYDVIIEYKVKGNGFTLMPIVEFLNKYAFRFEKFIPHHFSVTAKIAYTTAPSYDKVLWIVRNVGEEAKKRNDIRGQILMKTLIPQLCWGE